MKQILAAALVAATAAACGTSRNTDAYRDDTARVLATHRKSIKQCYDHTLAGDPTAHGKVAVTFTVEHATGAISNAALDDKRTTAPGDLGTCVLDAMRGLTLDPPDRRDGHATFVYEFEPPPAG